MHTVAAVSAPRRFAPARPSTAALRRDQALATVSKLLDTPLGIGAEGTLRRHALQSASAAQAQGAGTALVTACLLHDIGHALAPELAPESGLIHANRHAAFGAALLALWFPAEVVEPVRLHTGAKRYLCAIDPDYLQQLPLPARASLVREGGPFSSAQADEFIVQPYALDAVRLRLWADAAWRLGQRHDDLEHFIASALVPCLSAS